MAIEKKHEQHVFEFLDPEQIDALSSAIEVIELEAGAVIYGKGCEAEYFYVVLEGGVALRLPGRGSATILIEELAEGSMFGSFFSRALGSYFCTAQCMKDTKLLRIDNTSLNKIFEDDPHLGYAIHSRISQYFFKRYLDSMKKFQSIVMSIGSRWESRS